MNREIVRFLRRRAGARCEYCGLPELYHSLPFEVEHIIPVQHGGGSSLGNLAFACFDCNRNKGPNIASIDRRTSRSRLVRLFNPRHHSWPYHFCLEGPVIVGRTRIGRVTVHLFDMNAIVRVALRAELMDDDLYPLDE